MNRTKWFTSASRSLAIFAFTVGTMDRGRTTRTNSISCVYELCSEYGTP